MSEIQKELIKCVGCKKCLPCFMSINIPEVFKIYNQYTKDDDAETANKAYNVDMPKYQRATGCVTCNQCVPKCPMHINIPEMLQVANDALSALNSEKSETGPREVKETFNPALIRQRLKKQRENQ